nr:ATP-binding protein [uncultured Pseudodesulfovibrio sp.]
MTPDTRTLTKAHSLSRRAAILQMGLIGIIVLCFSAAIIGFNAYRLKLHLADQTQNISHLARTSLASAVWQVDHASAKDFIDAVFQDETVVFAQVITGREIMSVKARPRYADKTFAFFKNDRQFLTNSVEIKKYGDWIGTFRIAVSTEKYQQEIGIYVIATLVLAILLIGAISLTSYLFSRKKFFAPLKQLETSATFIADGDLDAYIDTSAPNELGNLARAIDDMRESLRHLIDDLQEANSKLQNHQNILETTVRKRTEELETKNLSLNEALREIRNSKKTAEVANQAKSSFLASMSHEIRTPMNAILGMADILWETELSEDQAKYVNVFRTAGESLLEILDDILDLSKIEAGHLKLESTWFSLKGTIDKICTVVDTKAQQKGLSLNCTIPPAIPDHLQGDPTRLRQILLNLLGNAVKFTDSGSVDVAVQTAPGPAGKITLQFSITDTGIGIAGDKLSTIFDSFTQADSSTTREFGGTGLGLAISKQLTQLMGGHIWAESTPGRGSTFHFTACFNIDSTDESRLGEGLIEGEEAPLPEANILMMEDSKYNAFVIQTYLKGTPCFLTVVENGQEGFEAFKLGGWDLILMDIQMPLMDGYSTTKAIRAWEAEQHLLPTPIAAMTAHALDEDAKRCLDAGADVHIPKPVKKSTLFTAIRQMTKTLSTHNAGADNV